MDQNRQPGEGLSISSELIHSILDQMKSTRYRPSKNHRDYHIDPNYPHNLNQPNRSDKPKK